MRDPQRKLCDPLAPNQDNTSSYGGCFCADLIIWMPVVCIQGTEAFEAVLVTGIAPDHERRH